MSPIIYNKILKSIEDFEQFEGSSDLLLQQILKNGKISIRHTQRTIQRSA